MSIFGQVLIVEDDPSIRQTLQSLLELEGVASVSASNGHDALELLRVNPAPRVILLDMNMPVMDGREFLNRMRQENLAPHAPVVVLTASQISLVAQGVCRWFTKPVDFDVLLEAIQQVAS